MRMQSEGGVIEWLRAAVLGDRDVRIARLSRDVDALWDALRSPSTVRPLITDALRQQTEASPNEMAALLAPVVERLLRERETPPPARRGGRWLPAVAATLVAVTGAVAITNGTWRGSALTEAAAGSRSESADAAPPALARAVVLQEGSFGFGLGGAAISDDELAQAVRSRLARCPELVGAPVSFSVTDGWVWLHGKTSADGRDAAARALSDLGGGAFVVNQLEADLEAPDMLARR